MDNQCEWLFFTENTDSTDTYIPCILWTSIKDQKGHTKVDVELVWDFDVENIPVEAQSNQGSLWTFYYTDKISRRTDR